MKSNHKEKEKTTALTTIDMTADAGAGFELADQKSFAVPFLLVLQGQSPQIETIDGAKPGLFLNSVTNELQREVTVLLCMFKREYLRWAPRSQGGGFRGALDAKAVDLRKVPGILEYQNQFFMDVPPGVSPVDKDGKPAYDTLADTRSHYVLVRSASGLWQPMVFSLKSTQIKKSRRWMTVADNLRVKDAHGKLVTPAIWKHAYRITTLKEENPEGSWHGVEIALIGPNSDPTADAQGKAFHDLIVKGLVETATPETDATQTASAF